VLVIKSQPNFPWIWIGNETRLVREDEDSDGLVGETSQQYPGALLNIQAREVNHNMTCNHPNAANAFNAIFNNRNYPQFFIPRRQ
jgi:hypothetical protein